MFSCRLIPTKGLLELRSKDCRLSRHNILFNNLIDLVCCQLTQLLCLLVQSVNLGVTASLHSMQCRPVAQQFVEE